MGYDSVEIAVEFFETSGELKADFGSIQTVSAGDVSASVMQTEEGAVISVVSDGVKSTATVLHGKDGEDGQPGRDGSPGKDGYTPIKGVDYFDGEDGYTPVKGKDYFDGVDGKPGSDGQPGKDGYTPIKGVDYFDGLPGKDGDPGKDGKDGKDGYTPIKGVDYFDGKDGVDGQDGYTPQKGIDYFDGVNGKDGKDGKDGYTPQKNVDYFDGKDGSDGADGVSVTHSWNGTTLTITSASGTSSANLKGDKGDKGESIKGDPGADGYTPVKNKDYFDGKDGKDGNPGADGVSPTVAVSKSGKVTTVSITDKNGTKTATINDGADGSNGSNGKDGTSVTVKSVSESAADGGSNVVTFSDGKTVTIKNGSKGSAGADGKTPVRGVDYYTEADQEAIVQQVITALGTPVFGRVDADNNIILTGELADGNYTVKYEDANGEVVNIGLLDNTPIVYTNVLASAVNCYGEVFNGKGYINGYRLSGNLYKLDPMNFITATDGFFATGYIPYTNAQAKARVPFYVKGISLDLANLPDYLRAAMYPSLTFIEWNGTAKFTEADGLDVAKLGENYYKFTPKANFYVKHDWDNNGNTFPSASNYIRFSIPGNGEGVIISVNEPLE